MSVWFVIGMVGANNYYHQGEGVLPAHTSVYQPLPMPIFWQFPRIPVNSHLQQGIPTPVINPGVSTQEENLADDEYTISFQEYGKEKVKLFFFSKNGLKHSIQELEVETGLSLYSEKAYREGDNSDIIATDSQKNTVYILAKKYGVQSPETFGLLLAKHFVATYAQVARAHITITQHPWQRIEGVHNHAFLSTPTATRVAEVSLERGGTPTVKAGLRDLTVLKTTQSGFVDFVDDEYRSLPDMPDRVFSTVITADWEYESLAGLDFDAAYADIQAVMLDVFAGPTDTGIYSRSVQQTQHETQAAILDLVPQVSEVMISMPNRHYFGVDFTKFPDIPEVQGEGAGEVLLPVDKPSGYITSTLSKYSQA